MKRDPDAALAARPAPVARPSSRRRWWPRAALAIGSVAIGTVGLLATTDLHGIPAPFHLPGTSSTLQAGMPFELAEDPMPASGPGAPGPAAGHAGVPLAGALRESPEGRLIGIYRLIGAGRLDAALDAAATLARDVPSFHLAHAVYADLLAARIGYAPGLATGALPPMPLSAASGAGPAASAAAELANLRDEAVQRLKALQERPSADAVPDELVLLPKALHHVIAVDTTRSRLYLFENGPKGIRLASDHYVSIGKQGVEKTVEGDQRTPLGVYFVSDRMGGGALEPQFGAGALQLNYPNTYDRLHGRSGGGIYVHGVPQDTYSRPPRDSDGCIALANDELLALMNTIPVHDTPVIITRSLHWVSNETFRVHRAQILDAVNRWQGARATNDEARLAGFYAPGAQPAQAVAPPEPPPPPATLIVRGRRVPNPALLHPAPRAPLAFDELSVLDWSDEGETFVVTFRERIPRVRGEAVLRQYWMRDKDQWRIVAEGAVH